jgi:excisionase family DNA binding protein
MPNPLSDEQPRLDWPAPLMTAAEVAAVLRITPKTVRQHIRRGSLRALRIDGTGSYRIRAEDAQEWVERQAAEPEGGTHAVDRYAREQAKANGGATAQRRRIGRVSA